MKTKTKNNALKVQAHVLYIYSKLKNTN